MRDKLKNEEYFKNKIEIISQGIYEYIEWIQNGEVAKERIMPVYQTVVWDYLCMINSKYSLGIVASELKSDLENAINIAYESWDGDSTKFRDSKGILQDRYYMDTYEQMLWMLSLGYLLNIEESIFKKLVEVIDRDNVKNSLYEFIIRAKIENRKFIKGGDYEKIWILYKKLRQAITETNKTKAENLVKEFITKDWYKEHKDAGWYNSHKSPHDTYCGYWSFETAAVVKIMGLDDSSFRDCQYYPKDLVGEVK